MKKFYSFFAVIATAAFAFSCAKEMDITPKSEKSEKGFEYVFRVANENSELTKTTLDGTTVKWETGDKIGVYAEGTQNKFGTISTLNPVQFPIYLTAALSAGDKVYCYYPQKTENDAKDANAIQLIIPSSQTGNFDAMPQVAIPYTATADMAAGSTNVATIRFCNIGSVAQFYVYSSTGEYSGETVESITFTANTALAGSVTFDLTAVDYDDQSTLATTGYSSLSAKVNASPAIGSSTDDAGVANLVIAPGTYYGTIQVKTDKARYTYTITEPNKITFNRSKIKKLALDLESANCSRVETHPVGEVFLPATSITAGDKVVLASGTSGSVAVLGVQQESNRKAVNYTITDGAIISTASIYPLTVGAGTTVTSYFTLYDPVADGYLYAASSSANQIKSEAEVSVNSEWEIVLNGESKATTLQATGSSTNRKIMRYNESNAIFSCYSSGQKDIYVFKKSTTTFVSAANQDIAYTVTEVEIPYNVYNASGATTVAFKTNPESCASNLAINEGTKKVTFDITTNAGATRTVEVNITNNGVTKTVSINQAAAPTKLVMSSITATPGQDQIEFSWDAVTDATGYQISTDGGTSWGSTQTATSYTWTSLSSFTSYTIKVKAIADGIYHLDSDAGSFTAKTTLALPTNITWTKSTKTVTWTDTNTGVGAYGTAYKYQYTIDNGANFVDVEDPGNTVTLTITETKTFKIRAVYISDTSLNSALSSGTTCLVGAPALYTANFEGTTEHRTSGTNNYSSNTYTVGGVSWDLTFSDAVSSDKLEGSYNVTMRSAKKSNNCPSIESKNILSATKSITKITYLYRNGATSYHTAQTLAYSTNNGSSWTTITASADTDVHATYGYSYTFSTPISTNNLCLKFTVTCTGHNSVNSTADSYFDNLIVYGE